MQKEKELSVSLPCQWVEGADVQGELRRGDTGARDEEGAGRTGQAEQSEWQEGPAGRLGERL